MIWRIAPDDDQMVADRVITISVHRLPCHRIEGSGPAFFIEYAIAKALAGLDLLGAHSKAQKQFAARGLNVRQIRQCQYLPAANLPQR